MSRVEGSGWARWVGQLGVGFFFRYGVLATSSIYIWALEYFDIHFVDIVNLQYRTCFEQCKQRIPLAFPFLSAYFLIFLMSS